MTIEIFCQPYADHSDHLCRFLLKKVQFVGKNMKYRLIDE